MLTNLRKALPARLRNKQQTRTSQRQAKSTSTMSSSNNNINNSSSNSQDIIHAAEKLRGSDKDLQEEAAVSVGPNATGAGKCPFSGATINGTADDGKDESKREPLPYQYIPLRMGGNGGTHKVSEGSRALIEHEVTLDDLKRMTHKFYENAFQDDTLDKFIRSHSDPHGDRFAKWIHQKLSGSNVWDRDRRTRDMTPHRVAGGRTAVVHDRSSAHAAAWYSPKRPPSDVGRHFTLEECRVWMRIHFWAMREAGIVEQSPSFADYYVRFIGHFVAVYERSATAFARESFRWSAKPSNIERYIKNGRKMTDVLGLRYGSAMNALPEEERYDDDWPYYQSDPQ